MFLSHMPLKRRIYLLLTLVITLPMIIFSYQESRAIRNMLLEREESNLLKLATRLQQRLPGSFDTILAKAGATGYTDDEKRRIINQRLQPVIDQIAREWPGYGLGYYSRDLKIVAFAPFREEVLGKVAVDKVLEIYDTKTTQVAYIANGFTQDGEPILALNYPLFAEGKLIGHVWANIKVQNVEQAAQMAVVRYLGLLFIIWGGMVLVFRWLMDQAGDSMAELAAQIKTGCEDYEKLRVFPEFVPILETVRELKARLRTEFANKEKMQTELAKLDRLNLVGEMAAGVAHEIRNPMTVIMGFIQLMEKGASCANRDKFAMVIEELKRVDGIINDFLSLAKTRQTFKGHRNLNDVIKGLYPLLAADCQKRDVWLDLQLSEDIPKIYIDEKEIRQLILNLARNSIEAMKPKGIVVISTRAIDKTVQLAVADGGCGIAPQELERIFDPFFTTKAEGTGLGLAVCKSIVERHGGQITVKSTLGEGTIFEVVFPATEGYGSETEEK